jgi:hypothetical protein
MTNKYLQPTLGNPRAAEVRNPREPRRSRASSSRRRIRIGRPAVCPDLPRPRTQRPVAYATILRADVRFLRHSPLDSVGATERASLRHRLHATRMLFAAAWKGSSVRPLLSARNESCVHRTPSRQRSPQRTRIPSRDVRRSRAARSSDRACGCGFPRVGNSDAYKFDAARTKSVLLPTLIALEGEHNAVNGGRDLLANDLRGFCWSEI